MCIPDPLAAAAIPYIDSEAMPDLQPASRATCSARSGTIMVTLKALRLAIHLLYALLLSSFYPLLPLPAQRSLLQRWSLSLLKILSIDLVPDTLLPHTDGLLLVSNHISWLDIFVINAALPCTFIAKSEVRSWPLIGLLCRRVRTLFIVRGNKRDVLQASQAITARLNLGDNIALFPEGTTTSGRHVAPFHASLFQCAIDAGRPLQPVAIRYLGAAGAHCEAPAYIDDMTLPQSILRILRTRRMHAHLAFLAEQLPAGRTRRELANRAHATIQHALAPRP